MQNVRSYSYIPHFVLHGLFSARDTVALLRFVMPDSNMSARSTHPAPSLLRGSFSKAHWEFSLSAGRPRSDHAQWPQHRLQIPSFSAMTSSAQDTQASNSQRFCTVSLIKRILHEIIRIFTRLSWTSVRIKVHSRPQSIQSWGWASQWFSWFQA